MACEPHVINTTSASCAAMDENTTIPVIDFEGIYTATDIANCPQLQQLHSAFCSIGFAFIKNHGIADRELIDQAFAAALKFFQLPMEKKQKYLHSRHKEGDLGCDGFICMEQESLDSSKPGDLKEVFDICSYNDCPYPDEEVPEFRTAMTKLFDGGNKLTEKILEMMGYALKLEDPKFFVKAHQKYGLGHSKTYTMVRTNYYPPIPPSAEIKPGQLRCGEHVDYGSITLLFQDPGGGLQVKRRDGSYIDVPYRHDAVLVNLGITIEHLTGGKYIASPHRVLIPEDRGKCRQSIGYFAHADNDIPLVSVGEDRDNLTAVLTAKEDTDQRLHEAIAYVTQ